MPLATISGAAALCALASCLAPPAVLAADARDVDPEAALERLPEGSEPVALELPSGEVLRGFFVPSDPGAPVALHLIEASGSAHGDDRGYDWAASQLSDLGWASLLVDYRGVGPSDGERSVDHLAGDAAAMFAEAARRAGGPERVVLRGTSLGTLAAATLFEAGVRPRAAVLISPVRAKTVTPRFARYFHGVLAELGARLVFRAVLPFELDEVLPAGVPLLFVSPRDDELLTERDRELLRAAAEGVGARWLERDGGHLVTSVEAHALLPEELAFWLEQRPALPDADARLAAWTDLPPCTPAEREALRAIAVTKRTGDPRTLLAAARATPDPLEATRLLWHLERKRLWFEPREALDDCISLADPAGPLRMDDVERAAAAYDWHGRMSAVSMRLDAAMVVAGVHIATLPRVGFSWSASAVVGGREIALKNDIAGLYNRLLERGLEPADAERQCLRIQFLAYRIPASLAYTESGFAVVAYLEGEEWNVIDCSDSGGLGATAPR